MKKSNLNSPIKNIDWKLFRKQKQTLINIIYSNYDLPDQSFENMLGILHLMDNIQDFAVDVLGFDEKSVFGVFEV